MAPSDAHTISSTLHSKMINIKWCNQKLVVLQQDAARWASIGINFQQRLKSILQFAALLFYIEMYHHEELCLSSKNGMYMYDSYILHILYFVFTYMYNVFCIIATHIKSYVFCTLYYILWVYIHITYLCYVLGKGS